MIDKSSRPDLDLDLLPPTHSWSGRFALFLAALALLFTLIGIGAGYRHWQRMNIKVVDTQALLQTQQQHLAQVPTDTEIKRLERELEKTLATQQQAMTERLKAVQELEQQTRQFAQTVAKQTEQITRIQGQLQESLKPSNPSEWQVAEVQFLLKLANSEWQITQNKAAALAALKEADQVLMNLAVVEYIPTRQQIARDRKTLEVYQGLDAAFITDQIQQLRQILHAPHPLTPELEAQLVPKQPERALTWWERYSSEAKALFSESFIIRSTDQPLPVILGAENSQQIYQLALLRLETLQLLLLQGNIEAAQHQIQLLIDTFKDYYPTQQAEDLIKPLNALQQATITNKRPELESLKVFNNAALSANHSAEVKP